jgi:hypothetical protein
MPIYFVIMEQVYNPMQYPVWVILKSIKCNLDDMQELYQKEASPLYKDGRRIQTMVFYREPDSPVQEKAKAA